MSAKSGGSRDEYELDGDDDLKKGINNEISPKPKINTKIPPQT